MKKIASLAFLALSLVVLLSGCGLSKDFGAQASDQGYMPEAFLPGDVGMVVSYSLRDDGQFAAAKEIEQQLGSGDELAKTFSASLESQFEGSDVSYEEDLLPAFGEQYRAVFASRVLNDGDSAEIFSITTLEDPAQLESVLNGMVDSGDLENKKLSSVDAYVDESGGFYGAIYEDLFLVASDPENLVDMLNLKESDSLWGDEDYQNTLDGLGSDNIFYAVVYPGKFGGEVSFLSGLGVNTVSSIAKDQGLVVRAADGGFDFDVFVDVDEDLASESGMTMDSIPRSEPYLFEEVPGDGLMAYMESYGMQQSVAYRQSLGASSGALDTLNDFARTYFGMDFESEFLSFWDKGYAFALHKNGDGVFPGLSIFVDVSSNEEVAQEFVDQLDQQISGVMIALDAALPGAVTKSTTQIQGKDFDVLSIDLRSLSEASALPSILTSDKVSLAYGLLDGRLLLTTASVWAEGGEDIKNGDLYNDLKDSLGDTDEGLILLDAQNIAGFFGTLRELRESLGLGVSDASTQLESFLKGFEGAIAAGQTDKYAGSFGGFLKIAK